MCDDTPGELVFVKRYAFRGYWNRESFCSLEIQQLKDDRTMVIATEVKDNPGTSITNMAEGLAMEVCRDYGIDPDKLVWIEHYGYQSPMKALSPRAYDFVSFQLVSDGHRAKFAEPKWRPMRDEDWR